MTSQSRNAGAPEGVIQYTVSHRAQALAPSRFGELVAELAAWRSIFAGLAIVGQRPDRYDGAGYGNVSGRVGPFPGARGARAFGHVHQRRQCLGELVAPRGQRLGEGVVGRLVVEDV